MHLKTESSQQNLSYFLPIRKQKKFHVIYVASVSIKLYWVQNRALSIMLCEAASDDTVYSGSHLKKQIYLRSEKGFPDFDKP